MKTGTKQRIVEIIKKQGKARPVELYVSLNLSPQIIHRHLKDLVTAGILESKGSAPTTYYSLAGTPDMDALSVWITSAKVEQSPDTMVCETREILAGRLPRLKDHVRSGLPASLLPLVISTAGEVANNSFDHNLGRWRDVPGCWFESQVSGGILWILVGDRGQGVLRSLAKSYPEFTDDQPALKAAYETIISGRAPEQRGNGLKFVRNSIEATPNSGLSCGSGTGRVHYGDHGPKCRTTLDTFFSDVKGTVTIMAWRLQ